MGEDQEIFTFKHERATRHDQPEVTEEMLNAGFDHIRDYGHYLDDRPTDQVLAAIYRAMYRARPRG